MKELRLWVLPNNGLETVPTLQAHLSEYAREHAGTRVVCRARTAASMWDDLFRILKDPRRGERPDVVQIPSHWTSTLAQLGLLQDLSELDASLDLRSWCPPSRDNCRLAGTGRVFSLPWWMEILVLYYRKDELAARGLSAARALGSWADLVEFCRFLAPRWRAGAGRFPIANPNPRESVSMGDLAACVWSRGGDFFSADGSRCLFQREDAFAGVRAYFELLNAGWMPLIGQNGLPPGDLFDGRCALQFSGRLRRTNGRGGRHDARRLHSVGVLPFPAERPDSPALVSVHNLAVLRDCENPRQAYGLVRELAREGSALGYAGAIGAFSAVEGGAAKRLEECPEFRPAFDSALARGRALPNLRVFGTLEKIFNRGMERAVRELMCGRFTPKVLRRELIHSAAEIDYVLSLYRN